MCYPASRALRTLGSVLVLLALTACDSGLTELNNANNAEERIGGSALHVFTEASPIAHSGYAYTKIDFCPNGHFLQFSESGLIVSDGRNDYNGEPITGVYAASNGLSNGTWGITEAEGQQVVALQFRDGSAASYPLEAFMSGSWERGRTNFAVDWGNGECR